jgi:hypothetical protein
MEQVCVMAKHIWNGHEIDVGCFSEPKFLWMLLGLRVRVDGELVGRSPGHLEGLRTNVPFQITDGGVLRNGRVISGHPFTAAWAPYRVFVEEVQIARGVSRAPNWYVTYGILLVLILALLTCLFAPKY